MIRVICQSVDEIANGGAILTCRYDPPLVDVSAGLKKLVNSAEANPISVDDVVGAVKAANDTDELPQAPIRIRASDGSCTFVASKIERTVYSTGAHATLRLTAMLGVNESSHLAGQELILESVREGR